MKIIDWDKYYMFGHKGYFDYDGLKAEKVTKLVGQAYRKFYLRPKTIFRLMKRKETWLNLPNIIVGGVYYLVQKDIWI